MEKHDGVCTSVLMFLVLIDEENTFWPMRQEDRWEEDKEVRSRTRLVRK